MSNFKLNAILIWSKIYLIYHKVYVQIMSRFNLYLSTFFYTCSFSSKCARRRPVLKSVWCTCLAKHHRRAMTVVVSPGDSRCWALHTELWSLDTIWQLCAEFGPPPHPNQDSSGWIFVHTGSMTVSQHAWKAQHPGVAQFNSTAVRRQQPINILQYVDRDWTGQRECVRTDPVNSMKDRNCNNPVLWSKLVVQWLEFDRAGGASLTTSWWSKAVEDAIIEHCIETQVPKCSERSKQSKSM